jgi:hypothetical protein
MGNLHGDYVSYVDLVKGYAGVQGCWVHRKGGGALSKASCKVWRLAGLWLWGERQG